jgi:hypothetical protein
MALTKQITLVSNFGDSVSFDEAYIKVESLVGNKEKMRVNVSTHKKENEQIIQRNSYSFTPNLSGKNFIAQAYTYLKTLDEFADATDC